MGLVIYVFVFGLSHGNFFSFFLSGIEIAVATVMDKKERRGKEEGGGRFGD